MLKIISSVLTAILLVLSLAACGAQAEEPIPEEPKPEKDWSEAPEEAPEEEEPTLHQRGLQVGEDSWIGKDFFWNEDSTVTFQQDRSFVTVNLEGEVVSKVNLSKEPAFEVPYSLSYGGKYILAAAEAENQSGIAYYTYGKKVHFANLSLYSKDGEHIKDYPVSKDNSNPPVDKNDIVMATRTLHHANFVWINETAALFRFYYAIGIYDFETDEGHIIWDGRALKKEWGATSVGPTEFGRIGDTVYFSSYADYPTPKNTTRNSLWVIEGETPRKICEGDLLFSDGENIVFREGKYAYILNKDLTEPLAFDSYGSIDGFNVSSFGGRINYSSYAGNNLHSYDIKNNKVESLGPKFETSAFLEGAREADGRIEYYFSGYLKDTMTLWRSEGFNENSEEYYTVIDSVQGDMNSSFSLDPNMKGYAVSERMNNGWFLRVEKFPE